MKKRTSGTPSLPPHPYPVSESLRQTPASISEVEKDGVRQSSPHSASLPVMSMEYAEPLIPASINKAESSGRQQGWLAPYFSHPLVSVGTERKQASVPTLLQKNSMSQPSGSLSLVTVSSAAGN